MSDTLETRVKRVQNGGEKSKVIETGLAGLGPGGNTSIVETKDSKILWFILLCYQRKHTRKHMDPWKIQRNGQTLKSYIKPLLASFSLPTIDGYIPPNRINYPLKRVDRDHSDKEGRNDKRL